MREGGALTVISWGSLVHRALEVAERLAEEGIEISVLDLRWLRPLDDEAVAQTVTMGNGRIVVAHEATRTGGFGAEIVARLYEQNPGDVSLHMR